MDKKRIMQVISVAVFYIMCALIGVGVATASMDIQVITIAFLIGLSIGLLVSIILLLYMG